MLSVGLLGCRGFMGSALLPSLVSAHQSKQLRLILLHRPESDTSSYPDDVEKRSIDLEKGDVKEIRGKLEGLEVVISAISGRNGAHLLQIPLLEAISTLPNFLTFFPSEWATPFRQEDYDKSSFLSDETKGRIRDKAKELGVPCTVVKNATVPYLLFGWPGMCKFDPNKNTLRLYEPQGKGTRGLTSKDFSGAAITHLLLNKPNTLPNSTFSLVEHHFSSALLIETFTKVNGAPPTIIAKTEQDYENGLKSAFFDAMGVASDKGLAMGCEWPGTVITSEWLAREAGWKEKSFEAYVRDYKGTEESEETKEWKKKVQGAIDRKEGFAKP